MNNYYNDSNFCQEINNKKREQFIAQTVGQFPRESLLELATTECQKYYWHHLRFFNFFTSECWLGRLEKKDPLIKGLEDKVMNQLQYDVFWSKVDTYQSLWNLLEAAEKAVEKFPSDNYYRQLFFNKITEVFTTFCEMQSINAFSLCLKPYHTVSKDERIKAFKNLRKIINNESLHPQNYNQIKSLCSKHNQNTCLRLYLPILYQLSYESENNQELLDNLSSFMKASDREAELAIIGLSRKRSSKNFEKFYSYTWSYGEIIRASKFGGVYDINKTSQQGATQPNQNICP